MINLQNRINAFVNLGKKINGLQPDEKEALYFKAANKNSWFTDEYIDLSLSSIASWLEHDKLNLWVNGYVFGNHCQKVGILMAGNIPLVGFHDLLSVLISGHKAIIKLSTQDSVLPLAIIDWLINIDEAMAEKIEVADKLTNIDAVIATGSNNSARYFHQYFDHLPHIIRKNRTSVAVLSGTESSEDFNALSSDIFTYFGLGCRNVSKIFVPSNFDYSSLLDAIESYNKVIHHHKYNNNYDYNKSIYLVNREQHFDNGFVLLKPSKELVSPLSVVFYEEYDDQDSLGDSLKAIDDNLQCIVSAGGWFPNSIPFGSAQYPSVTEYADGVDTMEFLAKLSDQ